ncbi:LPXTG cell wall anchor domain-containing protein [Micromonospora lupini]
MTGSGVVPAMAGMGSVLVALGGLALFLARRRRSQTS